jgi:phosphate-selective porin OprO/OprP
MGAFQFTCARIGGAALLLALSGTAALAADEVLLQILLTNKLITQEQYDAIVTAAAARTDTPAPPAAAERKTPAQDEGLLDVLLANGVITQEQYAVLQSKNADDRAKKKDDAKITLRDGFKLKSQDGEFSAQLGAYAQLDSAWYGDQTATDFSSGTELRRGRLSLNGTVFRDWDYKVEADFAGTTQGGTTNTVTVTDAFVRYNGWKSLAITAGNFKVPFSLEAVSSGKYLTFLERGLPFAFLNLRSLGGMVSTGGDNWTAALGLFGDTVTSQNNDDEGATASGRLTWAPLWSSDRVVHVGLSGQIREPAQTTTVSTTTGAVTNRLETVRFRSKPESNVISDRLVECTSSTATNCGAIGAGRGRSSGRLVDTGNIGGDVAYSVFGGAEAALVFGPVSLQGEYIYTGVKREADTDLQFGGYYLYGSWFITGESRNYKADKGVFDIIKPNRNFDLKGGGYGAWELGLRFSGIDLNDDNVSGGQERNMTVGLNWYPNSYVRLMANYVHVLEVEGGAHNNEEPDLFQVRAQVAY